MKKEKTLQVCFLIYILFVIRVIILKYPFSVLKEIVDSWEKAVILEGLSTANFTFLKTIKMYIKYFPKHNAVANLFGNILVFVPFGFMLPSIWTKAKKCMITLFWGLLFVVGIETFQLFSAFGAFDVDDILLNMLGIMLGYLLFVFFQNVNEKQEKESV
ncbi:MAG: VanZ family protein [Lachnospiraceae bacterium]